MEHFSHQFIDARLCLQDVFCEHISRCSNYEIRCIDDDSIDWAINMFSAFSLHDCRGICIVANRKLYFFAPEGGSGERRCDAYKAKYLAGLVSFLDQLIDNRVYIVGFTIESEAGKVLCDPKAADKEDRIQFVEFECLDWLNVASSNACGFLQNITIFVLGDFPVA